MLQANTATSVAPLTGAWIETNRGHSLTNFDEVAPLTGAWIETVDTEYLINTLLVAPLTGAWIETLFALSPRVKRGCRTPHGCVD